MAKTSLRAYMHDIEGMIDQGQMDQAIAHCTHLLQIYPKLVGAYRLLGKAYLESQRYADAADIFQRVLSCIPDDFVSHVGMSIIREDEGNLDGAIWHMERAFEVQPYNAAIQGEIRRLYGKRDGVEPPKIRLSRGALARMYARGELYQQAIGELRAGLAEDAQRPDLQVALARMYFLSDMRVEAVEVCSGLLKKLPFCLEANFIVAAILPETERKGETQTYTQRLVGLDPYLAHASPDDINAERVNDQVVMVEKYEWSRGKPEPQVPSQPAWAASLGVTMEGFTEPEDQLPDWMAVGELEEDQSLIPEVEVTELAKDTEEIPPSAPETISSIPEEINPEAEVPDWLSAIGEAPGGKEVIGSEEIPEWMQEAGWEPASGPEQPPPPLEESEIVSEGEGEIQPGELPDWLREMAPEGAFDETHEPVDEEEASRPVIPWLLKDEPGPSQTVFLWLEQKDEGTPTPTEQAEGELVPGEQIPAEILPGEEILASTETTGETQPLSPLQEVPDEMPDWLKAMAEETGLMEEMQSQTESEEPLAVTPISMEEVQEPEVEIPDWLKTIEIEPSVAEESPLVAEGEEAFPESVVETTQPEAPPEAVLSDEDAALAWLESLAAKQGVSEEELITTPDERLEKPPSWVEAAAVGAALGAIEEFGQEEEPPTAEEPPFEAEIVLPAWMAEIEEAAPIAEPETPAWIAEPEEVAPSVEPEAPVQIAETEEILPVAEPEIPTWVAEAPSDQIVEELPLEPGILAEEVTSEEIPPEVEVAHVALEPEAEEIPVPQPEYIVDINTASLIELETIPGLGYILAHNIISYRDEHGTYNQLDELINVPGITPSILNETRSRLKVGLVEAPQPAVLPIEFAPAIGAEDSLLSQARMAMTQNNIPGMVASYDQLIKQEKSLEYVIQDLREALKRFPIDVSVWQSLGDAYAKNNQLQEALDAYNTAEDLLK